MARIVKSQWDFAEQSPGAAARKILSVSELTLQIKRALERQIGQIWVTGEVTNLRAQTSGHLYFTLKDVTAQLSCVLFRGEAAAQRQVLEDGRKVLLLGELTVYEPRGQYQLRVTQVELQGIGALQLAFEKLKQKLLAEGLFAQERKRALPRFPQRIGLVTSATGAAIRDVLHVVARRNPGLEMVLVSCRVQGQGAALEIAAAIDLLNQWNGSENGRLDLILITRGGGSLEDLWAFNEEPVARAIFQSALPVVSAVGHEIDFTISDFVADFRAATPSAAAELITEGVFSSIRFLSQVTAWMGQRLRQRLDREETYLLQQQQRLLRAHPRRRLNERLQQLDDLQSSLFRSLKSGLRTQRQSWLGLQQRLARVRPALLLGLRRESLVQEQHRLKEALRHRLQERRNRLETLTARLRLLSPDQVLSRGYSITTHAVTGQVIRSAAEASPGTPLLTRVQVGTLSSVVTEGNQPAAIRPPRKTTRPKPDDIPQTPNLL